MHRLGDGGGQRVGGVRPGGADAHRFIEEAAVGVGQRGLQRGGVGGGVQRLHFGLPLGQQRRQLVGRAPVAASQAHPGRHACVQVGQALGLQLGMAEVGVERMRRVLQLRDRAVQRVEHRRDARVVVGHAAQLVDGAEGQRLGIGVGIGHAVERAAHGVHQRLGVGQALVFAGQPGPFAVAGRQLVQFGDLPGQALTLAQQLVTALAGLGQRLLGGPAGGEARRDLGAADARQAVEQRPRAGRPGEALPGVLAVDVEQVVGGFTQLCHRGGAAVDPGAALALGVDGAAQQQRLSAAIGAVEPGVLQPAAQCRRGVELGAQLGACGAFAHHAGIAPAAQHQLQRIDQDRLARAGLAGQHREAGVEFQVERRHDDEIAQGQAPQHR